MGAALAAVAAVAEQPYRVAAHPACARVTDD
jgi:hypothetical protein